MRVTSRVGFMGSSRHNMSVRGIRSGHWSGSKSTNTTYFDPSNSEIDVVWEKYFEKIYHTPGLTVIEQPIHPDFIIPVDEASIRETLGAVPQKFLSDLAAVIVLGGSKKQEKTFKNLFAYGRYWSNIIVLHPYPKKYLEQHWKTLPKPSILHEYERAGAEITRDGKRWRIRFDEESLKQFYLRDVLVHELGHHVDSENFRFKSHRAAENFAEWFASEYGYRPRIQENGLE